MKLIVGLGNPGRKYSRTRHNIGFLCLEAYASKQAIEFKKDKKFIGDIAQLSHGFLLKPSTYMNRSGDSVKALVDYYKIDAQDILIIHDDLDLPTGKIRLRYQGGHGGHKGLMSIFTALGTSNIKRIKFGIGKPEAMDPKDYVLKKFQKSEGDAVIESINKVKEIISDFLEDQPFVNIMNQYN